MISPLHSGEAVDVVALVVKVVLAACLLYLYCLPYSLPFTYEHNAYLFLLMRSVNGKLIDSVVHWEF